MAKAGRKSLIDEYLTDDGLLLLEGWARDGLTDAEIAHNMGISHTSFYKYRNENAEFANALKRF